MEIKKLGNIYGKTGRGDAPGNVYDKNYICPTLNTMQGGGKQPMIIDRQIARMVGRNPDNPSDRTVGSPTEQRLEVNTKGTSNCLTSVQKDNLVIETVRIKQATKEGYIECNIGGIADLSYPSSKTRRGRVQDKGNVAPTLMAGNSEICRIERNKNDMSDNELQVRKLTPLECWRLMGFLDKDFLSAKTGSEEKAQEMIEAYSTHEGKKMMDEAERISKMSNSQLYKQAGNSIVKDVLCAIFEQMIDQEGA